MSRRKGKLYGILSSAFIVSIFYKPTMKDDDIYYFAVLDDIMRLKMRFYDNAVLVIDEITQLSYQYIRTSYIKLFDLLKRQGDFTVLVSTFGHIGEFTSVCKSNDTPIVDCPELFEYSENVYMRFKDFGKGDDGTYGFYVLSIYTETFSAVRDRLTRNTCIDTRVKKETTTETVLVAETPAPDTIPSMSLTDRFITNLNDVLTSSQVFDYSYIATSSKNSITYVSKTNGTQDMGKQLELHMLIREMGENTIGIQFGQIGTIDTMTLLDFIIEVGNLDKECNIVFYKIRVDSIAFNVLSARADTTNDISICNTGFSIVEKSSVSFKVN